MAGRELKVDCKWHTGTDEEFGTIIVKRDADIGVEDNKIKGRGRERAVVLGKKRGLGKERRKEWRREKRNSDQGWNWDWVYCDWGLKLLWVWWQNGSGSGLSGLRLGLKQPVVIII